MYAEPRDRHGGPDPRDLRTQRELSQALSDLRRRSGLTVRALAAGLGIAPATLGGYLSGSHLPRVQDRRRINEIVSACGVTDPRERTAWADAVERIYGLAAWESARSGDAAPLAATSFEAVYSAPLRPPVERLYREPRMRGRTALFDELIRAVSERGTARVHVLYGLGGVGKSFLALNLAHWAMKRGIKTWWLSAGEALSVTLAMRALAQSLGVPPRHFDLGSPYDLTWELLDNYRRPWLLVVDNADDPRPDFASPDSPVVDATGWLRPPGGNYGAVVVTTRDGSADTWGASPPWIGMHQIRALDLADGARVLAENAGPTAGTPEQAADIAARLGGLPLALRMAGLHIREARSVPTGLVWPGLATTFAKYIRALDEGRHREVLDTLDLRAQRRARVGETWELSLEALEARGLGDTRALLGLLCCLSNAPIPYALLLDPGILESSPLFAAEAESRRPTRRRLWILIRAMTGLGLVDLQCESAADGPAIDMLVIHPVLRAVHRRHPDVRRRLADHVSLITALLDGATRDAYPSDPASWPIWHAVAPHCHSPLDLLREQDAATRDGPALREALRPAMSAAQYLRASERLVEAESLYSVLLDRATGSLGALHPEVLAVRQGLCRVWYAMGRWNQAEAGLRSLLDVRTEVLGAEHPDTLATRHYLARVRFDQRGFAEAESLFRTVLAARRRTLGGRHPATLSSMSNLAAVWRATGRLDHARRLLEAVLRTRRTLLGDDYPSTMITRQHLAGLRLDRGVGAADLHEFRSLAADTRRVLGAEHSRALTAAQLLGEALIQLGHVSEAADIIEQVLEARRRTQGDQHPRTIDAEAVRARLPGLVE